LDLLLDSLENGRLLKYISLDDNVEIDPISESLNIDIDFLIS
jgi:hypothetical protein